jgi:hypothetical protein
MLPIREQFKCLVFTPTGKLQVIKQKKNSTTYLFSTVARFLSYTTTLLVRTTSLRLLAGGCSVANDVVHAFDASREIWLLVEDVLLASDCVQSGFIELFTV